MRINSFGQDGKSILDHIIEKVRLRRVLPYVPHDSRLLDLGCGYNAELLTRLLPMLRQGTGIDLSVNRKIKGDKLRLIRGRVDKELSIDTDSVDVVTSLAIIEHVEYPQILLKEAYRVLNPGGVLLLTTPSLYGKYPLELLAWLGLISQSEIDDHKRYYLPHTLRDELVNAGFSRDTLRVFPFGIGYLNIMAVAYK